MNLFNFSPLQFQNFLLVFFRVGGILFSAPIFGNRSVPSHLKVGLALIISLIFASGKVISTDFHPEIYFLGIALIGEVFIGVIIGFTARLIFTAVQLSGQLVGFQMGFAIVNVVDPQTGNQIPVIAQFENILAILIFLSINAHHWFLRATAESFALVPPFGFHYPSELAGEIMRLAGNMFVIAVKIGAPMIAVLFFTSMALGVIARTVPQMNIFIVAFPLKIAIGLIFLFFSLPLFVVLIRGLFGELGDVISHLLKLIGLA